MGTKILASHSCTLAMPTRETVAPWTWPTHNMLRRSLLPKSKIGLIAFLAYSIKSTRRILNVVEIASRQNAIMILLVIFLYIKVDRTIALVGKPIVQYLLNQLLLFDDMTCCMWLNTWWQNIQSLHSRMIAIGIELSYLHWLKLLQTRLLLYLIISLISIVLQVTHIGYVAHIAHLITKMLKITE